MQQADRKLNRRENPKAISLSGSLTGVRHIALAAVSAGFFTLPALAAPASLTSPDATVYEQTSEESNPLGSLVEGSLFEYIDDITAEDGSVWHQVITAGGVSGYIRGDREMEIIEGETVRENQEVPAAEDGDDNESVPEEQSESMLGTDSGEAADRGDTEAGGGEDVENREGADREDAEGDAGEGTDDSVAVTVMNMQNNQAKSYRLDTSEKIKQRRVLTEADSHIKETETTKRTSKTDTALLLGIAVIICCGIVVYLFWGRMKHLKPGKEEEGLRRENKNRVHKKNDKKNTARKRRAGDSLQGRKGNMKNKKAK